MKPFNPFSTESGAGIGKVEVSPGEKKGMIDMLKKSAEYYTDAIGSAWKETAPGIFELQVITGMTAKMAQNLDGQWELKLLGQHGNADDVGVFATRRHAYVALVKLMRTALDDTEKMRAQLWDFVMKNEMAVM